MTYRVLLGHLDVDRLRAQPLVPRLERVGARRQVGQAQHLGRFEHRLVFDGDQARLVRNGPLDPGFDAAGHRASRGARRRPR